MLSVKQIFVHLPFYIITRISGRYAPQILGPAVRRTQGLASLAGILCIPKMTDRRTDKYLFHMSTQSKLIVGTDGRTDKHLFHMNTQSKLIVGTDGRTDGHTDGRTDRQNN